MKIPRDHSFDGTLALLADPYRYIAKRCRQNGSDAFATRLMLRRVVCVMGVEASRMFYTPDRFTRRGAYPMATSLDHQLPPQDLTIDMSRIPAVPRSRYRMRNVRWRAPATVVHAVR
jgi:hypothetical protein